jgi:hypothetical protein
LRTDYERHPGVESFSVAIDSFAVRDGEHLYLVLPREPAALLPVRSKRRALPLYTDGQNPIVARYVINLPPETAAKLILPEEIEWTGPSDIGKIAFETHLSQGENGRLQLILERCADLGPALVAPADYARLVSADERMQSPDAWTLMLKIAD